MAYKFMQIRNLDSAETQDGVKRISVPIGGCAPIKQLGIQTFPGAIFYLNDSIFPIVIGKSGIYELEAVNGMKINSLEMDRESYEKINKNKTSLYLIIDVVGGEEE